MGWRTVRVGGSEYVTFDDGRSHRHRRYFVDVPQSSRVVISPLDGRERIVSTPPPRPSSRPPPPAPREHPRRVRDRAVLGLRETFTVDELRAAMRRAARQNHPDQGGDPARMSAIGAVYDRLLREDYDE